MAVARHTEPRVDESGTSHRQPSDPPPRRITTRGRLACTETGLPWNSASSSSASSPGADLIEPSVECATPAHSPSSSTILAALARSTPCEQTRQGALDRAIGSSATKTHRREPRAPLRWHSAPPAAAACSCAPPCPPPRAALCRWRRAESRPGTSRAPRRTYGTPAPVSRDRSRSTSRASKCLSIGPAPSPPSTWHCWQPASPRRP